MVSCIDFTNISCLKFLIITTVLFLIPLATSLSFNHTTFSPDDGDISYERAAYAANGVIQLTGTQRDLSVQANIGRASYVQPLHLWDMASGSLADFATHFSFVIDSRNTSGQGDGIAFFLAPNGSRIPDAASIGGSLGLTTGSSLVNSTDNPFVSVEFDTYTNVWDPENEHVGIDISSMRSVTNVTWMCTVSIRQGRQHQGSISYDSQSKNLSVIFTGYRNGVYITQTLYYRVDLRDHLPEFVTFGFSSASGSASALNTIYSWSFSSTLEVKGNGNKSADVNPGKSKTGLIFGLAVGGLVLVLVLCLLVYIFRWKRKRKSDEVDSLISEEFEQGSGPRKFAYYDLKRATNNFAQEVKLGEGGFGAVYKGFLKGISSFVAVKRVSRGSKQGIKEYASEVKIISRLRHRNLVQLLGWCHEKHELLLVYEYMPNGSLDSHLFKGKAMLDWVSRFKVAQGLASALFYLHEQWDQCVVHRDIKSSNVMLDASFNAKLGDFGLARLVDHEKGFQTTIVAGTMGYMAPECISTGKASKETDVFSFGVVALEIACGRRSIDLSVEESRVNLVEWVWSLYGTGNLLDAADSKLGSEYNSLEMEQLMIVGLWCTIADRSLRPSIRQAVLVLNSEAPLPVLPLRMYALASNSQPLIDMIMSSPFETETTVSGVNQITEYSKSTLSLDSLASSK